MVTLRVPEETIPKSHTLTAGCQTFPIRFVVVTGTAHSGWDWKEEEGKEHCEFTIGFNEIVDASFAASIFERNFAQKAGANVGLTIRENGFPQILSPNLLSLLLLFPVLNPLFVMPSGDPSH
jgi:hypothetical protein